MSFGHNKGTYLRKGDLSGVQQLERGGEVRTKMVPWWLALDKGIVVGGGKTLEQPHYDWDGRGESRNDGGGRLSNPSGGTTLKKP